MSFGFVHEPKEDVSDCLTDVAPVVHEFTIDTMEYRLKVVSLTWVLAE